MPTRQDNLAEHLARIYRRVVLATILIFSTLVLALLVQQYFAKRNEVINLAIDDLQDRSIRVDNHLNNAAEDIIETRIWAENYFSDSSEWSSPSIKAFPGTRPFNELVMTDIPPIEEPYGTFIQPKSAGWDDEDLAVRFKMASRLLEILRINHYAPPSFKWSEYRSLSGFVSVYPRVGPETGALIFKRPVANEMLSRFERVGEGLSSWEFSKSIEWSKAYVDASSGELMITCASPVYDKGRLTGMVSAEMGLDFLKRFVEGTDTPSEKIIIVNGKGQILSATGLDAYKRSRVPTLSEEFPEVDLGAVSGSLPARDSIPAKTGGNYVISTRLNNGDWKMITLVPDKDVIGAFDKEALLGALLVVLMFVFLIVANKIINRYFVNPAVGFVDFIETEAVEGSAEKPDVPVVWEQWFTRISDILALKSVAANLPGAIFQMKGDAGGGLALKMASAGVNDLLGLPPEELLGKDLLNLDFMQMEDSRKLEENLRQAVSDMRPVAFEALTEVSGKRGRWVRFILRPRETESGEVMWDGLMLDISERKAAEDELRRHRDHLEETVSLRTRELEQLNEELRKEIAERTRSEDALKVSEERLRVMSQQIINSQDDERARLSRELHDEIGQQLAAILFQLTVTRSRDEISSGDIIHLEEMTRDLGEDLHRICRGLQPMTLTQFGLGPAVKMMLWEFMEVYGKNIVMRIEPPDHALSDGCAAAAYRICQEAVTNSIRYSGADDIHVSLYQEGQDIILEVRDQGKGFDMGEALSEGKLGITGMRQRAQQCGGKISIESCPGKGTIIVFKIAADKIDRELL